MVVDSIEKLKMMIAGTLGISVADITDDFSLRLQKFKTSAGSVILGNMVKKAYGRKVDCRNVSTFGELVLRAEGKEKEANDVKTEIDIVSSDEIADMEAANVEDGAKTGNISGELPTGENCVSGGMVCGIDIQEIEIFPEADDYWSESFYTDNFTDGEIAYCVAADSPRHSFAARWCLKEALHKCGNDYFDIPLKDIQSVKATGGVLRMEIRNKQGGWIRLPYACSISHTDNYAVGIVTGIRRADR